MFKELIVTIQLEIAYRKYCVYPDIPWTPTRTEWFYSKRS